MLLTTQYLDEADHLASRVVIIDHGRVVAVGTPTELKQRVGRSVIEVHMRSVAELPRVAQVLGEIDHGSAQIDEATRRVSVSVEMGVDQLRKALARLEAAGAEVEDISLRPPTLDEVFLAITGHAPDGGPAPGGGDDMTSNAADAA